MRGMWTVGAGLGAGAAMWVLAGLWHEGVAVAFYQASEGLGHGEHQGIAGIFLIYLALGLVMAWAYARLRLSHRSLWAGLAFGAMFGLVWVLPNTLLDALAHGDPLAHALINGAWHMLEQGLGGVTLSLAARRATAAAPA